MAISLEQFVQNLFRAGLFTSEELTAFQESLPPGKRPKDAQGLARELIRAGKLTKYQAEAVYRGRAKGLVFGEYTILERIGAGGMGEVWKARHRMMKREVAVKVLPARSLQSPDAVKRFYREVEAAAQLTHPNIVTAFHAGEQEGIAYLVMELVEGQDLASLVQEHGPLSVEQAVECVSQAARGLEYAHGQGVVHRDVKPGNLLLAKDGTVKILDMGLARLGELAEAQTGGPEHLTGSGQVLGTCQYMAPEQAEDTHRADHRADIYSLGCTLYRLLTGEAPFPGETLIQVFLAHREADIPSLCAVRPDVPAELDAVYQKMMAKRPEDRQQSMGEVIAGLATCLKPEPVGGGKESSTDAALRDFLENLPPTPVVAHPKPKVQRQETLVGQAEAETGGGAVRRAEPGIGQKKWMLAAIAGCAVALLLLVVLVMVLSGGGDQEPGGEDQVAQVQKEPDEGSATSTKEESRKSSATLIVQWPEQERTGARLEVDGEVQDLTALGDGAGRVRVTVSPGSHSAWIARRGYEPIERTFSLRAGEESLFEPEWKASRAELVASETEPEVSRTEPSTEPAREPERTAAAEPTPPPKTEDHPAEPAAEVDAALKRQQELEEEYTTAMNPVEELVAGWDFREALAVLGKVQFEDEELAARLIAWREGVARLVDLKARIIAAINEADPPLRTTALLIRGAGRDLIKADEGGLTTRLRSGETEPLAWPDMGPQALEKLIELVSAADNADDRLAAGVLSLASKDPISAEDQFEQARSLGAEIGPYLAPLAAAALNQVRQSLEADRFSEAEALLANLEAKYADTAWFATNRKALTAARAEVKQGIYEAEAEKLYAEAGELFQKEQLFDVKPLVEKLKTDYANSPAVTDVARNLSFGQMEKAVAELGQLIMVRQDGKGDFTSIQAAIDAAPPNSLIEIQDKGPYNEKLDIPREKEGLTLRGARGAWPIVTSAGPRAGFDFLVLVRAAKIRMERIVLAHSAPGSSSPHCLHVDRDGAATSMESCVLYAPSTAFFLGGKGREVGAILHNSVILGGLLLSSQPTVVRDSLWFGLGAGREDAIVSFENVLIPRRVNIGCGCTLRGCTVADFLRLGGEPVALVDCILHSVEAEKPGARIERCALFSPTSPFVNLARPGAGCFQADPQFVNPANLDYRLLPTSPCIGKASDGGDLGVRYTPEMIEIIQKALELRAKGIIKF